MDKQYNLLVVDDNQEIAKRFQIMSIPNMKLLKDGEVIGEFAGNIDADDFEEKLAGFV